jgi:hypothetical protein
MTCTVYSLNFHAHTYPPEGNEKKVSSDASLLDEHTKLTKKIAPNKKC